MGAQGRWCNRLKEKVKVVKFIKGNVYLFLLKYSWFIICKFQVYSMTLQLYICVCMYFSSSDSLPLITQYGVFVPCGILMLLLSSFSCDRLCVTLWTAAHQTPLSMGFSRQEYWSGVPLPSPQKLMSIWKCRLRSTLPTLKRFNPKDAFLEGRKTWKVCSQNLYTTSPSALK